MIDLFLKRLTEDQLANAIDYATAQGDRIAVSKLIDEIERRGHEIEF